MIATPPVRNALVVGTSELRFGTFPVRTVAQTLLLITVITTVILEVTQPSLGYASVVGTAEISSFMALGAILRQLITAIPAVVLAVAEQPLGNAPVVGAAWTSLPSSGTIALPAHICGFI